jgi:probable addiction module antidote protein
MNRKTRPYREALLESLADPVEAAYYLSAAIDDSPEMFRKACLNVIQARRVSTVARTAGVTRESLYRSFSATGNPKLDTLQSVLQALDLKIGIEPQTASSANPVPEPSTPTVFRKTRTRRGVSGRSRASEMQLQFVFDQPSLAVATPASASAITMGASNAVHIGTVMTGAEQGYSGVTEIETWSHTLPGFFYSGATNSVPTFAQ